MNKGGGWEVEWRIWFLDRSYCLYCVVDCFGDVMHALLGKTAAVLCDPLPTLRGVCSHGALNTR